MKKKTQLASCELTGRQLDTQQALELEDMQRRLDEDYIEARRNKWNRVPSAQPKYQRPAPVKTVKATQLNNNRTAGKTSGKEDGRKNTKKKVIPSARPK